MVCVGVKSGRPVRWRTIWQRASPVERQDRWSTSSWWDAPRYSVRWGYDELYLYICEMWMWWAKRFWNYKYIGFTIFFNYKFYWFNRFFFYLEGLCFILPPTHCIYIYIAHLHEHTHMHTHIHMMYVQRTHTHTHIYSYMHKNQFSHFYPPWLALSHSYRNNGRQLRATVRHCDQPQHSWRGCFITISLNVYA